jgi:hypothetical protein
MAVWYRHMSIVQTLNAFFKADHLLQLRFELNQFLNLVNEYIFVVKIEKERESYEIKLINFSHCHLYLCQRVEVFSQLSILKVVRIDTSLH